MALHKNSQGNWMTSNAIAVNMAIERGSMDALMSVLVPLEPKELANALRQCGFMVQSEVERKGRNQIILSVQEKLVEAIGFKANGFELDSMGSSLDFTKNGIAANTEKHFAAPLQESADTLDFTSLDFTGDPEALKTIQEVMSSKTVMVELLGDEFLEQRASLNFIASESLQKKIQAFGFEDIAGKYMLDASLGEMKELYANAGKNIVENEVRHKLHDWAEGKAITHIHDFVGDDVQRVLHGPVTVEGVKNIVSGLESGEVGNRGRDMAGMGFSEMMRQQGIDVNQPTVEEQAAKLGMKVVEPDLEKGQYIGPVIGVDHRAAIVRYAKDKVVVLPFKDVPKDQSVRLDEMVSVKYRAGELQLAPAQAVTQAVER